MADDLNRYILQSMAYDILIKNGTLIDGSGNAPVAGDIAVKGEEIVAIGNVGNVSAEITIDSTGKYVTPGFIDITNHSDTHLTLFKYPAQESAVMQGITTIIGGNCGASLAPLGSKQAIHAIKKWVDPSEINVNWATTGEFLEEIEKLQPAVNFGTFVGYGTLRRGVIGDEIRPLTLEEKDKVKFLLKEGVKEGAFGLSLGLAYGHERVSTTEEIIEIAKVLPPGSIIKFHLRSEGADIIASINEAVRIGRETGISIQISHMKAIGKKSWHAFSKALNLIKQAKSTDLNINFDVSPYHTTGSQLYLLIPGWARYGGFEELFKHLDNAEERDNIIKSLQASTLHYDKILVTSAKIKNIVGKTIAEIAQIGGISPEEALVETVRANEGRVSIIGKTVSSKNTMRAVEDENSFISSDGEGYSQDEVKSGNLAHPRSFGAFPHFWHRFVNDFKTLTPEMAIRKITLGPAEKLGLKNRGLLKKGYFADIAIFDLKLFRDRGTYRNPFRYPAGIEWVLVNGQVAVERGRPLGTRAGKILRKT